jgi:hypothetical protein
MHLNPLLHDLLEKLQRDMMLSKSHFLQHMLEDEATCTYFCLIATVLSSGIQISTSILGDDVRDALFSSQEDHHVEGFNLGRAMDARAANVPPAQ